MIRAALSVALVLTSTLVAQRADATAPHGSKTGEFVPQKLSWPRDRERVVCVVADEDHTLEDLLEHIQKRHHPGIFKLLELPGNYFATPIGARWVRQYADIVALEAEAIDRGIEREERREILDAALKRAFENWLADHVEARRERGISAELTETGVQHLLSKFQLEFGLQAEVQGWLDFLVPEIDIEDHRPLIQYYESHAREFGGRLDIAHILIETRDRRTGELKTGHARDQAMAKFAEVRKRLKPDGSNFADLAREYSDDRFTAKSGGRLRNVARFDPRLPAVVCRSAWHSVDGQVEGPIETPFGIQWVQRLSHKQVRYFSAPLQMKPAIAGSMRQDFQEDLLFGLREAHRIELKY